MVEESAAEQQWTFVGDVAVSLEEEPALETGVFHIRSTVVDLSHLSGGSSTAAVRSTPT